MNGEFGLETVQALLDQASSANAAAQSELQDIAERRAAAESANVVAQAGHDAAITEAAAEVEVSAGKLLAELDQTDASQI